MHKGVLHVSPMCGPSEAWNSACGKLKLPVHARTGNRLGFTSGNKCVRAAKANHANESSAECYLSSLSDALRFNPLEEQGTEQKHSWPPYSPCNPVPFKLVGVHRLAAVSLGNLLSSMHCNSQGSTLLCQVTAMLCQVIHILPIANHLLTCRIDAICSNNKAALC